MARKLRTVERFIGIIGPSWSGKTVLLTSLLDHLHHHHADRFNFHQKAQITRIEEKPVDPGWSPFPFLEFRDRLSKRLWPSKTTDRFQYFCEIHRSDWQWTSIDFKFIDLPGERINDILMIHPQSDRFDTWSDQLLRRYREDRDTLECFSEFQATLAEETIDREKLLQSYRVGLAKMRLTFRPYLSPSTFLLDRHGEPCRGNSVQQLSETRYSGLSPEQQFAPLSEAVRTRYPELAQSFAAIFDQYRDEIVVPWVRALRSCHTLVPLIDILEMLAGGHGVFNNTYRMIKDLFDSLKLENPKYLQFASMLTDLLPKKLRPVWVQQVAFVAPKLDRVHPMDRQNIQRLLKEFTRPFTRLLEEERIQCAEFSVAAVIGTQIDPTRPHERVLLGSPHYDTDGNRILPNTLQQFSVSEVPGTWPRDWVANQFTFPEVYPEIPPRFFAVPDQLGLAELFAFLCR